MGAGAAGLMAAIHCARGESAEPYRDVVVVESTRDGGRKILISGGGRCNILPGETDESRFVSDSSPNTMKKMLRSWPLAEQRRFFEQDLGIALVLEEESGKLFPAGNRAREVRDALVREALARGVSFRFETTVVAVDAIEAGHASGGDASQPGNESRAAGGGARHASGARWRVRTAGGETIEAASVVLATGGLSVPKTGSDGTGLLIARGLGHACHPAYAALTPLVCEPARFGNLAGISLDVTLTAPSGKRSVKTRGGFLFTHRGYSGPAVLDISHLAVRSLGLEPPRSLPSQASHRRRRDRDEPRQRILVQWSRLDRQAWEREFAPKRASVLGALRSCLPHRLAEALIREAGLPAQRSLAELHSDEKRRLLDALTSFELPWTGHEGYRTAEVTGGGIALSEVDPRTMESRRCPGLFFCGEMLDAFGPIGGFNFQWAWATGRAAGTGARQSFPE